MRLADETVVAVSVGDILIFPANQNSFTKCGVPKSELLGTFVSIDKSTPPAERSDVDSKETRAVKGTTTKQ